MSKHNLVADIQGASFLEQVVGPGKGRVFEMVAESLSIGRSDDNDIVIPSNSVSRNHALLKIDAMGQVTIEDNGSKNGILVNGNLVNASPLSNGDIVQVGDFAFRFNNPLQQQEPAQAAVAPAVAPAQDFGVASIGLGGGKTKAKGPPSRRPLIYGLAALVIGAMYFMQEPDPNAPIAEKPQVAEKKEATDFAQPPYLENLDPNKAKDPTQGIVGLDDPAKSRAEIALDRMDFKNSSVKEAEQYFRRGRREYLNHSLQRAIQFFRTALSFDRSHGLAQFYMQLAIAESEKQAAKHFELGVKYFDSLQYERANYHFAQVQQMLAHRPQNEMLPKARKYISVGQTRLRAAELFP